MMILMMIQIQGVVFSLEVLLGTAEAVLTVALLGVVVAVLIVVHHGTEEDSTVADLLVVGNIERIIEK